MLKVFQGHRIFQERDKSIINLLANIDKWKYAPYF